MKISFIIITYNAPRYLALVLESVKRQSQLPYEVVVADDGSTEETRRLVESMQADFPCLLTYVWQEDKGFRVSKARNEALKVASGDYIIFSDGDLLFHRHFVKDFTKAARPGFALIGTRLFLSRDFTEELLEQGSGYASFKPKGKQIEKNALNGMRVSGIYRLFKVHSKPCLSLRGGLAGMYRTEIDTIGGFDESYEGWGAEDTDMVIRLLHSGVKVRKLKHMGLTYHLWHVLNPRPDQARKNTLLQECIDQKRVKALRGI